MTKRAIERRGRRRREREKEIEIQDDEYGNSTENKRRDEKCTKKGIY